MSINEEGKTFRYSDYSILQGPFSQKVISKKIRHDVNIVHYWFIMGVTKEWGDAHSKESSKPATASEHKIEFI